MESQRIALVTGSGSGIGAHIAQRLAGVGYEVCINDLFEERAKEVADSIVASGGRAFPLVADVTDEDSVNSLVDRIVAEHGAPDVLVNNAGIGDSAPPSTEKDIDVWQKVFDVNVRGSFLCARRVAREMIGAGRGSIVNISSIFGLGGVSARSAYGPSKAAVVNLTETLATEWGGAGVRVNAVAPGFVRTPLFDAAAERDGYDLAGLEQRVPAGRLGSLDDVAGAVLYLASDAAAYVNGTTLIVDGGLTASLGVTL